ncbi:MAG: MATE family efflux transporter [Oscillospiraceae bacterium]|nr:MATE family efflux transporter [Oscillospiraceae bacterium]
MAFQKKAPRLGENKMRTMPVGRLLFSMALPLVISMLVQALYNVVDSVYVAKYSQNAVTALSLAFPIQNLQIGCSTGIAVGVNSLLSKSLGEGNRERANKAAGNGILLTLIVVALFMLFGAFGAGAYYDMQPISQETRQAGTEYTAICCIFTAGIFVEILGERLLQASGRTVYTLYTQGIGAVLNILLDPLFIFGFAPLGIPSMGAAGAAVATVIGQWVAAILAVIFNLTRNPDVRFSAKYLRPQGDVVKKILAVGVPSMIMMAIGSVMNFGMNQIFLGFPNIGETASGVFGVYFKLQSFFLMPVFGLNNASISILAYNYGARQPKRITGTLKYSVGAALGVLLLGVLVFQLFPEVLMSIFTDGEQTGAEFIRIGVSALRIVSLHFPIAAVGIALGASFQALGNGVYSSITSLCRQLLALLPAAYLLSLTGNVDAVWWSFPIAEVVSIIVTLLLYSRIYQQKVKPMFAQK